MLSTAAARARVLPRVVSLAFRAGRVVAVVGAWGAAPLLLPGLLPTLLARPAPALQLLPSLSVWGWSSVVAENDNLSVTNYFIFSDL